MSKKHPVTRKKICGLSVDLNVYREVKKMAKKENRNFSNMTNKLLMDIIEGRLTAKEV